MKIHCQDNIIELELLANKLCNEQFTHVLKSLSGATIGQHYRHIIELYQCLLKGIQRDEVNYDSRIRDKSIEMDIHIAVDCLDNIKSELDNILINKVITLKGNYACEKDGEINIITSVYRELAYNLEHSIHHQALIKVALIELDCNNLINDSFGVAPSTIRFKTELMIGE